MANETNQHLPVSEEQLKIDGDTVTLKEFSGGYRLANIDIINLTGTVSGVGFMIRPDEMLDIAIYDEGGDRLARISVEAVRAALGFLGLAAPEHQV